MLSTNIQITTAETYKKAAELLHAGKLVAFPTETVYGLGADATNDHAVAGIFSLKGRPSFNPLIIHVIDIAMAKKLVAWNQSAEALASVFWPGPLTLVLPRGTDSKISLLASAGGNTLGIRMPAHPTAQKLLKTVGIPLAAPSANRSGRVSPTTAQHVNAEFATEVPLIIDGGDCKVGIESTVIDVSTSDIIQLRPGFITKEQVEEVIGKKVLLTGENGGTLMSPGMLLSHYAPSLPVRLNVTLPEMDEAFLAFGSNIPYGAKHTVNLSVAGDLREAAARLFASLRELDKPGTYKAIAVMPVPEQGIGVAINDRLRRAAA